MDVTTRRAVPSDEAVLRRAVYAAWRWSEPWDETAYEEHLRRGAPDSYVDDFGARFGDAGVIATLGAAGAPIGGAAWFRLFTGESARAGYVDDFTPEIVLAVEEKFRGAGIGGHLLDHLQLLSGELFLPGLSLHVDSANAAAAALYESRGFSTVRATPKGTVMAWSRPEGWGATARPDR